MLMTYPDYGAPHTIQCILYNIKNKTTEKIVGIPVTNWDEIIACLFNTNNNAFNIITLEKTKDAESKTHNLTFYQLDVDKNNTAIEKLKQYRANDFLLDPEDLIVAISWTCINGNLVGIDQYVDINKTESILLFNTSQKELFSCEERNGNVIYMDKNDNQYNANFTLIKNIKFGKHTYRYPLELSFIPLFPITIANIIHKSIGQIPKNAFKRSIMNLSITPQVGLDLNHFHLHFVDIKNNTLNLHYLFDPKLIEVLHTIHKMGSISLADAYFLYHYYTNPTKWHIKCKQLINPKNMLISPAIQKIYGLDQLTTNPLKPPKPSSFWEAYKRGKFLEYTKQQFQTYKKQILGGATIAGTTWLAAWLLRKSKLPNVPTTSALQPIRPANRSWTSAAPARQ